jgi:hypothetical protein
MKKLLTLAALLGAANLSFGQGIVSFANQPTTRISTNGTLQVAAPVGSWYYGLFRAPSTHGAPSLTVDPLSDGWTLVAIGTNTASAGRLNGNQTSEGVVTTAGAPSTDDYAVAGWSSNIGSSWASVQAFFGNGSTLSQASHNAGTRAGESGWFSVSATFGNDIIAQPTGGSINTIFGATAVNGFNLGFISAVPEPSTFALAGLGAAAMLIFRRRKQ